MIFNFPRIVFGFLGALLVVLLGLPLLTLLFQLSLTDFEAGLSHPLVAPAVRLSLFTSFTSVALVFILGTPLAWMLSQTRHAFARALETFLHLPLVLPPAVAGVALLWTFGRRSVFYSLTGVSFSFSTGAVILAEVFVSAPFFLQAALQAFRKIDEDFLLVAQTFGASPFRIFLRLGLPLAWPGILSGLALSWARALGEFGATLLFAGNLPGTSQTLPLAIYTALETDLKVAQALSVLLLLFAMGVLVFVRMLSRPKESP